jgi:hypothetical protein
MDTAVAPAETADGATPDRMFKFSEDVDVGVGAVVCEDRTACSDPTHFHAWCRLPNQFQHQSIRDKAQAAKARRVRLFADPDSDISAILDAEIAEVRSDRERMVDELVAKHFAVDQSEALRDLQEEEEFANISEDSKRAVELGKMPADERPADEFDELSKLIERFNAALREKVTERQRPLREALGAKDDDELAKMLRDDRVARDAGAAFNQEYTFWECYLGTLKPVDEGVPTERVFDSTDGLRAAAPEVIEALSQTFDDLEAAQGSGVAEGN